MKLLVGISTAACMAAIIAIGPAGAASLTIGGGDGSLLSLGGSGDSSLSGGIDVSIGGSGDSGSNASVGLDADADANLDADVNGGDGALLDLFGTVATGDGGGGGGGVLGDPVLSLFGPGGGDADDIETGSVGAGGSGDGGDAGVFAAMPPQPGQIAPSTTAKVATRTKAGKCFTPDDQQIDNLLGRTSYDASVAASWKQASRISIVSINLCRDAQARLAAALQANANIKFMRNAVAANAKLMAELHPSHGPGDVLAVDKAGENVTVYVY